MVARFDAQLLNGGASYDVLIEDGRKELARVRADLAGMR
jgi:hypothetical protein